MKIKNTTLSLLLCFSALLALLSSAEAMHGHASGYAPQQHGHASGHAPQHHHGHVSNSDDV